MLARNTSRALKIIGFNHVPGVVRKKNVAAALVAVASMLIILLLIGSDRYSTGWVIRKLFLMPSLFVIWYMIFPLKRTLDRYRQRRESGEEYCFECTYRMDPLPEDISVCPECGFARRISGILWDEYYDERDRQEKAAPLSWRTFVLPWRGFRVRWNSFDRRSEFTKEEMFPKGTSNAGDRE